MPNYNSILISGPTASGKSKLALDIAEKVGGVVINADSMQIYNTISLITARPSNKDMDTIPHFLYGYIDPKIRYSVGEWVSDVEPLINFLIKVNKIPVIVGGTGLYFAALFESTTGHSSCRISPTPNGCLWKNQLETGKRHRVNRL